MTHTIPATSAIDLPVVHYVDSVSEAFEDPEDRIDPLFIAKALFTTAPKWIDWLLQLRHELVRVFGLKVTRDLLNRQQVLDNFHGEIGDRIGLFQVVDRSENEIVMGEDDKHLDFRFSLLLQKGEDSQKTIILTTIVKFNNRFGRWYFVPVKPFHILIVKRLLRNMMRELRRSLEV